MMSKEVERSESGEGARSDASDIFQRCVLLMITNQTVKSDGKFGCLGTMKFSCHPEIIFCIIFKNDQHSTRKEVKNSCFYKVNNKMDDNSSMVAPGHVLDT